MRATLTVLIFGAALLGAATAQGKLTVAATVPDLAAIATAVGGDRVKVIALTLPTQDPHFVDARPHLVLRLNRADLLLLAGLGLEAGWLPTLLTGARNAKIQRGAAGHLDCSTLVRLKEIPRVKIDRSMGDIHVGGNPHYLTDAKNGIRVARGLARRLSKIDPAGSKTYWQNAKALIAALERAQARWSRQLARFKGTPVVTYHRSWIYFTDAMGLRVVAQLEPKPGIPPNAAHVLRVIRTMRAHKAPVLLQEEYYPDRTAKLVVKKTGAKLLILPGGTHLRRGETYLKRLEILVTRLLAALKAKGG
jgi:zinc/manganese transport system substrate-binding protein